MKEENSSSSSLPTAGCCCSCRSSKNTSTYDGDGMTTIHVFGRLGSGFEEAAAANDDERTLLPQPQHLFSARSVRCFINESSNSGATRLNLLSQRAERMSLEIVEGISPGGFGTVVKVCFLKTPNKTTTGGAGYVSSLDYNDSTGVNDEGSSRNYGGNNEQQQGVTVGQHIMSEEYEMLALKVIPKKLIRSISRELEAIKGILNNSPFIQKMLGVYDSGNNVLFLSEIIVGGDLFTHIARGLRFGEDQGRFILAELFLGIEHIHSCNFIHGDIKVYRQ
jgi:serine/threonine protein kinase